MVILRKENIYERVKSRVQYLCESNNNVKEKWLISKL